MISLDERLEGKKLVANGTRRAIAESPIDESGKGTLGYAAKRKRGQCVKVGESR